MVTKEQVTPASPMIPETPPRILARFERLRQFLSYIQVAITYAATFDDQVVQATTPDELAVIKEERMKKAQECQASFIHNIDNEADGLRTAPNDSEHPLSDEQIDTIEVKANETEWSDEASLIKFKNWLNATFSMARTLDSSTR